MPSLEIEPEIRLRHPQPRDGANIHKLVQNCPPLDLNSLYAYLLIGEHHAHTSVVAEAQGEIIGFISAYQKPTDLNTLFVWQVAVSEQARGKQLALKMLHDICARPNLALEYIETTIGPDNKASQAMFQRFSKTLSSAWTFDPHFNADMFGTHGHEPEYLFRIGPVQQPSAQQPFLSRS